MKLPYIIIFDIDNTIIGDINYPWCEYATLNKINIIYNTSYKFDFVNVLNEGLLRPYVNEFVDFMKKKYKNVEIFVYTNSKFDWVHNGLMENLEKVCKFKINKPYITYNDSLNGEKLLSNAFDIIIKELLIKYPALKNPNNIKQVFDNRLIFIDDIPNNLSDYPKKQIVCPIYNYTPIYDIYEKLVYTIKIDPDVFNNKEILELFDDYGMNIYNNNGSIYQQNKKLQELNYSCKCRYYELLNNTAKKDTFFLDLIKILDK